MVWSRRPACWVGGGLEPRRHKDTKETDRTTEAQRHRGEHSVGSLFSVSPCLCGDSPWCLCVFVVQVPRPPSRRDACSTPSRPTPEAPLVIVIGAATPRHCTQGRYAKTSLLQPGVVSREERPQGATWQPASVTLRVSEGALADAGALGVTGADCRVAHRLSGSALLASHGGRTYSISTLRPVSADLR